LTVTVPSLSRRPMQVHQHAWLHGPLSAVDPEAVDRDIAAAAKALSKLGKVRLTACPWGPSDQFAGPPCTPAVSMLAAPADAVRLKRFRP
jgi:hypothetical protein